MLLRFFRWLKQAFSPVPLDPNPPYEAGNIVMFENSTGGHYEAKVLSYSNKNHKEAIAVEITHRPKTRTKGLQVGDRTIIRDNHYAWKTLMVLKKYSTTSTFTPAERPPQPNRRHGR